MKRVRAAQYQLLLTLAILGLMLPPLVAASDCIDYRDFMHWEGTLWLSVPTLDIMTDSAAERAYVSTMTGIAALMLTDPANPALLDTLDIWRLDRGRTPMARFGNQLWVAARERGLCLIQTEPLALTASITTPGEPRDIEFAGNLAMIADWDEGLQIYDAQVSPPARLGGIDLPGFAAAVTVAGDQAYVADLIGLSVVDIATPATPHRLSSIILPGQSTDVVVRDDIAYVASTNGLHIVDVSNPNQPERIDTFAGYISQVVVTDDHLVLSGINDLYFLDLVNPRKPALLGVVRHDDTWGLAALDDRLYLAGSQVLVLNHEHFALPPVIGQIEDRYYGFDRVVIADNVACVSSFGGLSIVDVSDPTLPVLASQVEEREMRLSTAGNGFAYMVLAESCVILDLAKPTLPAAVARTKSVPDPIDCALAGDRFYVLSATQGLQVMDVSQPDDPIVRSVYDPAGGHTAMAAQGSRVLLGGYDLKGLARLLVVDATNPSALHAIGGYEFSGVGSVRSLAVDGNRVYLSTWSGYRGSIYQLVTLDLSDPAHPTLLGQVDMQAFPTLGPQLEVHGSLLYLWGSGGFTIVDMRDPNSPVMVANGMQESMNDLAITPDWIATTNGRDFRILPLQCQSPAPVELSSFEATPVPGAIRITWHTAREWDHLGFHVERATDAAGTYARLTDLIPPPGPYAFLDQQVAPGVTYFYRLAAVDRGGRTDHYGPLPATALPASHTAPPPLRNQLAQSHPNPFLLGDRETAITYSLATAGRARLRLFDATGRLVATLVDADLPAGEHTAIWNGQTVRGESAPAGTYFYRLEAGSYSATRQLVRLR